MAPDIVPFQAYSFGCFHFVFRFFHTKDKAFQSVPQSHIDKPHFWETIGRTPPAQDLLYLLIIALVISSHFIYLNEKNKKNPKNEIPLKNIINYRGQQEVSLTLIK